jgi:hypothetical protein
MMKKRDKKNFKILLFLNVCGVLTGSPHGWLGKEGQFMITLLKKDIYLPLVQCC